MRPTSVLRYSFFVGAIYFLVMSVAHAIGLKVPGLFIYFNIPSYVYQDLIISALLFGWASFFFAASWTRDPAVTRATLIAGAFAVATLTYANLSTPFAELTDGARPLAFHIQVAVLGVYWVWLLVWHLLARRRRES
jgi:hypothetical protein